MKLLLQKLKATYHRYPLITSLSVLILFGATITFATPPTSPYTAGETLDPSCAPGDTNCTATILPDQTGNSGKYLTTDGTTSSWATVSGGITSLNALTGGTQTFATGTSGTDFDISSSGTVHTFNIPTASGSSRGLLSSSDWTTFNSKFDVPVGTTLQYVTGDGTLATSLLGSTGVFLTTYGNNAGNGTSSGTFIGSSAGASATSATSSTFVGSAAGQNATSASLSVFVGHSSGSSASSASSATFIGASSGASATNASQSTFGGAAAGSGATNASNGTFLGYRAGFQATGSSNSNFIGHSAGYTASTATYANFFGTSAGYDADLATLSNFIGYQAGYNADNAANSIFIGIESGKNDTVNNTVSGSSILLGNYTNTGGFSNSILLGSGTSGAPIANTAANQFMLADTITNVRVSGVEYTLPSAQAGGAGYVLSNNGSGVLSWAVDATGGGGGYDQITEPSVQQIQIGDYGVSYDGNYIDILQQNVGTGYTRILASNNALADFRLQTGNPFILFGDVDGIYNGTTITIDDTLEKIILNAPNFQFNGVDYVFPSAQATDTDYVLSNDGSGTLSWVAGSPVSIGTSGDTLYTPGLNAEEGDTINGKNIFLGLESGSGATSAYESVFLGYSAGIDATNAIRSNFFGSFSGQGATDATNSTFMGIYSGNLAVNAENSVFLGGNSGRNATDSSYSNFIGVNAGYGATSASYSNFIGISAGRDAATASNSIFIGTSAGNTDTVDNTLNGQDDSSILIGNFINTGGFSNSILLGSGTSGAPIANTEANQLMIADTITNTRLRGIEYALPSAQATDVDQVLINDGTGVLSWGNPIALVGARNSGAEVSLAQGDNSVVIGTGLKAYSAYEISIGSYNSVYIPVSEETWEPADRLFAIGNGEDNDNKSSALIILKNGLTGIGYDNFETTTETALLQVNGSILQTGATSCSLDADADGEIICTVSDQKLKKDVTDMSYGLSHIMQLHPVGYNFIDTKYGSGPQIGFIAQELEQIIPEVVTDGPDYKSVNYALLTSVITKAVQELNLKLTTLETFSFEDTGGFTERLREFFENAGNGIRKIFVKEIQTDKLCVGTTCVTETQLQQLLNQSGQSGSTPSPEPEVIIEESVPVAEDTPEEEIPIDSSTEEQSSDTNDQPPTEDIPPTEPSETVPTDTPESVPEPSPEPIPDVPVNTGSEGE